MSTLIIAFSLSPIAMIITTKQIRYKLYNTKKYEYWKHNYKYDKQN